MAEHEDVEEARQEPKAPGKGKAKAKGLRAFDGFGQTTETAIAVSEDNVRAGAKFSTPHATAYTRPPPTRPGWGRGGAGQYTEEEDQNCGRSGQGEG